MVVGLDNQVTYEKFVTATLAIQKVRQDAIVPIQIQEHSYRPRLLPGARALSFVATATQVEPIFIGKPEAVIMDAAVAKIGLAKDEVLMVGMTD